MSGQSLLMLQKRNARRQPFAPRYDRMRLHRLSSSSRSIPLKAGLPAALFGELGEYEILVGYYARCHTNQSVSCQVETAILLEIGRQTVIGRPASTRFRPRRW